MTIKAYALLTLMLLPPSVVVADGIVPYYRDVNVVAVNKESPHSDFRSYPDKPGALSDTPSTNPRQKSLNGIWKFLYSDSQNTLPDNIESETYDYSAWKDIKVPGNWELQGFGDAIYTNIPYDFMPSNPKPPPCLTTYRSVSTARHSRFQRIGTARTYSSISVRQNRGLTYISTVKR